MQSLESTPPLEFTPEEEAAVALLRRMHTSRDAVAMLGALDGAQLLTPGEQAIYASEAARDLAHAVSPAATIVAVLKATRLCNLRCVYCRSWAEGPNQVMRFEVLARITHETLAMHGAHTVEFVWHGGEVTLLKPKFFKKMIWLQQRFKRPGQVVKNSIQSNATHLTDEWLDFLAALKIGVGLSLDGPPEINDARRIDKQGRGSTQSVLDGIRKLRARGIPYGVLMVVDQDVLKLGPARLLEFLVEEGIEQVDFLNALPENDFDDGVAHGTFLPFSDFVRFLCDTLEVWRGAYRDRIKINVINEFVDAIHRDQKPSACLWSGDCADRIITVEANGDIAPCDKYVGGPDSRMGNVLNAPLYEIIRDSSFVAEAKRESARAAEAMRECRWHSLCRGGCPHDRTLSRHLVGAYDGHCCGMAPFFDQIQNMEL